MLEEAESRFVKLRMIDIANGDDTAMEYVSFAVGYGSGVTFRRSESLGYGW